MKGQNDETLQIQWRSVRKENREEDDTIVGRFRGHVLDSRSGRISYLSPHSFVAGSKK